jgi:hypothetical protein
MSSGGAHLSVLCWVRSETTFREIAMSVKGGISRRDLFAVMALSMASSGTLAGSPATAKAAQAENTLPGGGLVIATSHSDNVLSATSGGWRIWSLSDGYIEMPTDFCGTRKITPFHKLRRLGRFAYLSIASPLQVLALMAF